MTGSVPRTARVVIVGGGIAGCSVAYHLAREGWTDVVLLERGRLTGGTTWHAAGLVAELRATRTMTALCRYGAALYDRLEAETGHATGFRRQGSLAVARTPERLVELKRLAALARCFDIEHVVVDPARIRSLYPAIDESRVLGGVYLPRDGQTNPVDTTMALAAGARANGVRILEGVTVTGFRKRAGAVCGVVTDHGDIACEVAVNCAGLWARDVGRLAGVHVPLYAAEHMYIVTEPIAAASSRLPILRDPDGYIYVKEDAGKLLVGAFEPESKPLPVENLPAGFEFGELPEDWDQFEGAMRNAMEIIPALAEAGIRQFLNGPESFTPDNRLILGEAPELTRFFVAAGFNSQGIQSGAGAGWAIAHWIVNGAPTIDLSELDIARFHPFQANRRYLHARTRETLGLLYAMHWPYRQAESARPVRRTPLHDRLAARGACFGEVAGWERANWFAPEGVEPRYEYSWQRQNWFAHSAAEHRAVREAAGLFDLSSFAKLEVAGSDALAALQRVCARDVDREPGSVVYTLWLDDRAGIVSDVTVTRLDEERFLVVSPAAAQTRDFHWLRRHLDPREHVTLTDVTSAWAVLALAGPRAREILSRLTDAELDNEAFPFATARDITVGYAPARAIRVSYTGELGWELHVPAEFAVHVFDALLEAGEPAGLRLAGYHALDSLRLERGFRHFGHDITPGDTPVEAGMLHAVSPGKPVEFVGRAALRKFRDAGVPTRRLVHFLLEDPEPVLLHDELVVADGNVVGTTTSGAYGHTLGGAVAMGWVNDAGGVTEALVAQRRFEIGIAGERFTARASLAPFYDPHGARLRG